MSARWVLVLTAALATACAGETRQARVPASTSASIGKLLGATKEEAVGDANRAKQLHLDALDALPPPEDPWHVVLLQASLDALVGRQVSALTDVSDDGALVYRTKDAALWKGGDEPVATRLPRLQEKLEGPFGKGLVARTLLELAEHRGDWEAAEQWRTKSGCAREATVVGPLTWTSVTGVKDKDPLEAFDAPLAAKYDVGGAFGQTAVPLPIRGRGCQITLSGPSTERGVRDVVVDLRIKEAGTIGVALRASGAATLRVGGKVVLERPYELGDAPVLRMARVKVERGTVRLVARVGMTQDGESLELGAWDANGAPLAAHAPRAGERGTARATEVQTVTYPAATTWDERVALSLGALAANDGRTAERLLSADARATKSAKPELLLVYARAVDTALDLPPVYRAERTRAAYERVLEAWPGAWEAVLAHAVLAGDRRGQGEARIETLRDLDQHRKKDRKSDPNAAVLDAFDAVQSARDSLFDRARAALERAAPLEGSSLLHEARRIAIERNPVDRVRFECSANAPNDRRTLVCYNALHAAGDTRSAADELQRLRRVHGASDLFLSLSLHDALISGDRGAALSAYRAMLPGERTLQGLMSARAFEQSSRTGSWPIPSVGLDRKLVQELLAAAPEARDAPYSIAPLLLAAGEDPFAPFTGVAERVTAADRARPVMANAATVILAHDERYEIDPRGVTHYRMLDVRRVSGTTDVESNAQASPAAISGKASGRVLRRRIFKKDGRILEPDRTPNAAQAHADLAQLEQGDTVEAIYEGWALPGETGDIGIDTPDLLPDRTAVANASIEIRFPAKLKISMWHHPLLGKPSESADADAKVLRWTMKDRVGRRQEDGTPKMDRRAGVSLSTTSWNAVARALRETLASFDEHDPEVAAWAREASKGKPPSREMVAAVIEAAGTTVREASQGVLSDLGIGGTQGAQSNTARTILTEHEGSRTWLIVRALRELGVAAKVAIAEEEPFSADPNFPPQFGRFLHPLAVARVPDGKGAMADVWIDADVPGPPLPAGRISPELRGRMMLDQDGTIGPVPTVAAGDSERDEVSLRLALDEKGNAKGTLDVTLRGRAAQDLAEALVRVVGVERQRMLRSVVLAWVPFANVDEVALSSSEGSWQVGIRAELTVGGYAQIEGARAGSKGSWVLPGIDPIHIVFPRAYVTTLGAVYARIGAREEALAINRATQYHAHVRIELPKGAKPIAVPAPFELKSGPLEAKRRVSVTQTAGTGAVLEDDFVLSITTSTISKAQYGAFVANAHRTDDAFLASTRIAP